MPVTRRSISKMICFARVANFAASAPCPTSSSGAAWGNCQQSLLLLHNRPPAKPPSPQCLSRIHHEVGRPAAMGTVLGFDFGLQR